MSSVEWWSTLFLLFNNRLATPYPNKFTLPSSTPRKMPHIFNWCIYYKQSSCTHQMMPSHFSEKKTSHAQFWSGRYGSRFNLVFLWLVFLLYIKLEVLMPHCNTDYFEIRLFLVPFQSLFVRVLSQIYKISWITSFVPFFKCKKIVTVILILLFFKECSPRLRDVS